MEYWVAQVKRMVLYEMEGVSEEVAREASACWRKTVVKTRFATRNVM